MDNRSSPEISSFILRFVQDKPVELTDQTTFRGTIRHIQTDQELSFVHWIDAVYFMSQFVPEKVFELTNANTTISKGSKKPE